jgi:hypothetical protein
MLNCGIYQLRESEENEDELSFALTVREKPFVSTI